MLKSTLLFLFLVGTHAFSATEVITSLTDLAWATREIGGSLVEVKSLLKGPENPHYVDAVPEFIRLASNAKVACMVGLDLEVGWMPKVLERSGNAQIQPGGKGYCETGKYITVLEKPAGGVDRSMGDVHPSGNPHFWLSPKHLGQASRGILEVLINVDPANAAKYKAGYEALLKKLSAIEEKSRARLQPLVANHKGPILLEYHKEFAYFLETYGLISQGSIEEKPGISPSAGRLAEVALGAKNSGVRFVLAADTAPKKTLERFAELSGLPIVQVPMSLNSKVTSYEEFQDLIVSSIIQKVAPKVAKNAFSATH